MRGQARGVEDVIGELRMLACLAGTAGDSIVSRDRGLGDVVATLSNRIAACAAELDRHVEVVPDGPERLARHALRDAG